MSTRKAIPEIKKKLVVKHKKINRRLPDFDSLFNSDIDPLPDFVPGDLQASADREVSEIERTIAANRKASHDRFLLATDKEYYFLVCFQSKPQRDQFIECVGWQSIQHNGLYVNGLELADLLGVKLGIIEMEPRKLRTGKKKFIKEEVISHA